MEPSDFYINYFIPTAILAIAFALKFRAIVRFWSDPHLKAVGGLLVLAVLVFFFAAPPVIAWVNRFTRVPNFSAPWVYTLLTAFSASCLVLLNTWRGGPHAKVRRTTWLVVITYVLVIIGLWVLFALAYVPVERLRDLDTYYANTPYMREHIVLYLLAHTGAGIINSVLLWTWPGKVTGWVRSGLVILGVAYVLNLVYDGVKFSAIIARWNGANLDGLSTDVAPPVACLSAIIGAAGFILPHAGERFQSKWSDRIAFWRLNPLYRTLRAVAPPTATVELGLFSALDVRLTQRETFIRDSLLQLSPYFDEPLRQRALDHALSKGITPDKSAGMASAVALLAAIDAQQAHSDDEAVSADRSTIDGLLREREIESISRALRRPATLDAIRQRAAARPESVPTHE
ncbi:MAB_1171c family putative transporter [Streptomyces sp. NPDC005408]|uniref:MAB_1171c family putative transporter n=1 Tax=Streptomyces sp. NPDC005408 TaxID=3155341 RepID=UPI0033ADEFE5